MWWLIIPGVIIAFVAVLLVRTAAFKPKPEQPVPEDVADIDSEHAVESLRQMVRCKTVSSRDESTVDRVEFEKFHELMKQRYPNIHAKCTLEHLGKSGLLYHCKGKSSDKPSVMMAHYDVVPANEAAWQKPAFEGIIENGELWGRGTLDTKITLCGACEAMEKLLSEGFVPEQDVYLAFSGDEEIAGETAPFMVDEFKRRGIKPELVVDEGGAVVTGIFPGVTEACAVVGIAEKGMLDVEFSVDSKGGHASSPPPHTPVGVLAKGVCAVENNPSRFVLSRPAAEMFDTLGRRSTFVYRMIFANLWCFRPVLDSLCKKSGGELNALLRTTCAFTMMQGSNASNVLPPSAKVGANMRLIPGDTIESAIEYLKAAINNPDISVTKVHGMNPSICSDTSCESYEKLKRAIAGTWRGALISPYLMIACSDSRHYCRISDHVYRFSAMALSSEERARIHGNDERIELKKITEAAQFYLRLLKQC